MTCVMAARAATGLSMEAETGAPASNAHDARCAAKVGSGVKSLHAPASFASPVALESTGVAPPSLEPVAPSAAASPTISPSAASNADAVAWIGQVCTDMARVKTSVGALGGNLSYDITADRSALDQIQRQLTLQLLALGDAADALQKTLTQVPIDFIAFSVPGLPVPTWRMSTCPRVAIRVTRSADGNVPSRYPTTSTTTITCSAYGRALHHRDEPGAAPEEFSRRRRLAERPCPRRSTASSCGARRRPSRSGARGPLPAAS